VSAADFTVADVLAWARTKPADERYNFCDPDKCAVAQFGLATGRAHLIGLRFGELRAACSDFLPALIENSWTFGALVKRLEAFVPETPITQSNWLQIDAYLTDIEQVPAMVIAEWVK
jgi:hypothetical protein